MSNTSSIQSSSFRPLSNPGSEYCDARPSVVRGFLCNDKPMIAKACAESASDVDRTLCDDQKLAGAQEKALEVAKWSARKAIELALGFKLPF
ncbi:MAG: hypothetical protein KBF88_10255 [Polyangiaceae bacterium]|nr:hypothetical protein [Polyangiaceae bacterium]